MSVKKIGSFGFKKFSSKFRSFKKTMPLIIANEAKNHFIEGFRKGGGQTDASRSGWRARKRADSNSRSRAILVKSGDLRADIKNREVNFNRIVVGTRNIAYAVAHNEGESPQPQREFIGDSKVLEMKIQRLIHRELRNIK